MLTTRIGVLGLAAMTLAAAALYPGTAQADGPWKAQIVDAETGRPLSGVVVLAYWIKYKSSVGGWAGGEFYDSEEVVTETDGRLTIQARSTWTLNPFRRIAGPEFVIFKPGYGQWRFQGAQNWPIDAVEHKAYRKKAWEQFTGEGVVIELPRLKTREERLRFVEYRVDWAPVPFERAARLRQAKDEERAYLGLPRIYERKP